MPTTESTPTTIGRLAATTLPKISTSRSRVIGRAIISDRTRSSSMVVPTSRKTSAKPPTCTVTAARSSPSRGASSSMRSFSSLPSSRAMRPTTRARSPSSLRRGGAFPSDQYETTPVTSGSLASSSVSAWPAAATAASSTSPERAVTTSTTLGTPVSNRSASTSSARADSDDGFSKPADVSSSATPPPPAPATTRKTTAMIRTAREWLVASRAKRVSMVAPKVPLVNNVTLSGVSDHVGPGGVERTSVTGLAPRLTAGSRFLRDPGSTP